MRVAGAGVYHRCDACEYVFVVDGDGNPEPRPPRDDVVRCPRCQTAMQIVGQSETQRLTHYECAACFHVLSRPIDEP